MKNKKGIVHSTIVVTLVSFLIKLLGLIKQSVLAAICGATVETDAFFVVSGVLISLSIIVFSAISISLVSIHTKILRKEGRERANDLINVTLRVFIPIALVITLVFYEFAPQIGKLLAPSYEEKQLALLAQYIQIMSPAFMLWCYYLIINVVLETDKVFVPGKMQGLFQNVFLILTAIFLYPKFGIHILLYAFLLSGLAQCILVTWCARKQFRLVFHRIRDKTEIKHLIRLSTPLIIGSAIYEINDIVDKQIATKLGAGNVSYLTYGATINEIVTGVIVASVSTVLFAHFVTWISDGNIQKVEHSLKKCIEYLTILIMPVMVMCLLAGDQIVQILYGRGNFGVGDVKITYGVIIGYAVGFIFQAVRANVVKVFYAFQDTRTPMINGAIAVGANIVLSMLLSKVISISGVAVATSISMLLATVLLLKAVKKHLPDFSLKKCRNECVKSVLAGVMAMFIVYLLRNRLTANLYFSFVFEGIACMSVYILMMYLLKSKAILAIRNKLIAIISSHMPLRK